MRHVTVSLYLTLGVFTFFSGCGQKPQTVQTPNNIDFPKQSTATSEQAIWFSMSNYTTGGTLARLDLKTGKLHSKVFETGPDIQILQDGNDGLFLLTRMKQDSVSLVSGPEARLKAQFFLPEGINPQSVARDTLGRIWITSFDSNFVQIISPDLSTEVGSVDLSDLKEENSTDGFAELAHIIKVGADQMVVSAQRFYRKVGKWRANEKSGLAIVNIHSFQPEHKGFIDAPNPNLLYTQAFPVHQDTEIFVIGAGDLFSAQGPGATINRFLSRSRLSVASTTYPYKILSAHVSSLQQPPAVIAWYQTENKSCVQIGEKKLICEGSDVNRGYVFNKILRHGDLLFVSYVAFGNSQLWVMSLDGTVSQKIDMDLPITSMCFGPQ